MRTNLTGTILIVDDEDGVRSMLSQQLTALGHSILEARHGLEALHLVRTQHGRVDVVLTDVVMPHLNGTQLAATLIGEFPELPVILMSAYAPRGLTRVGIYQSVVPVLVKPFTQDRLADLIQIALDRPGRPVPVRPATAE
jgi:CheY-like chemotaxis protein